MVRNSPFRLTKWYLDCVSQSGDAVIYYAAHVFWRGVRLRYSSLLSHTAGRNGGKSSAHASFPADREDMLTVDAPSVGLTGTWRRLQAPIEKTLFANDEGEVQWDCLQPRAATELHIGDHAVVGLGYAERLTLTIPPWRLPLRRLQWGRWLSPHHSLIWIDWSGPLALRWTWLNGLESAADQIAAGEIRLQDSVGLQLDRSEELRGGRLGNTVLPGAPLLARAFPRSMFGIQETKWLSSATLTRAEDHESGWAIHEVVEWAE